MPDADPDAPVTLTTATTEFGAHALVARLEDAGVEARAFAAVRHSLPLDASLTGVPVQVRRRDLDRARQVLAQGPADAAEIQWEDVDVGVLEDEVAPAPHTGMPLVARIGFAVAVALALVGLLGFVLMLVL